MARHRTPEIFNTDQDSEFTSVQITKVLAHRGTKVNMDGKRAWRDNILV